MLSIPEFFVAGIPLVVVVFAMVEVAKSLGATGKVLTILSLVLGFLFASWYQLAIALPVDAMGWLVVVVIGVLYGATASGIYKFADARWPAKS